MKNPENKPLHIIRNRRRLDNGSITKRHTDEIVSPVLVEIMKCQVSLIKAGKNSAMPHFIACIKELEQIHGFRFEQLDSAVE